MAHVLALRSRRLAATPLPLHAVAQQRLLQRARRRRRRCFLTDGVCHRLPSLCTGWLAQVLLENGFLYDSTILETPQTSLSSGQGARVWPYTMQDGVPQNCAWWVRVGVVGGWVGVVVWVGGVVAVCVGGVVVVVVVVVCGWVWWWVGGVGVGWGAGGGRAAPLGTAAMRRRLPALPVAGVSAQAAQAACRRPPSPSPPPPPPACSSSYLLNPPCLLAPPACPAQTFTCLGLLLRKTAPPPRGTLGCSRCQVGGWVCLADSTLYWIGMRAGPLATAEGPSWTCLRLLAPRKPPSVDSLRVQCGTWTP